MLRVTHPVPRAVSGVAFVLSLVAIVLNFVLEPLQGQILPYALLGLIVSAAVYLRTATLVTCQSCGWRGSVPPWQNPKECPGCREAENQMMMHMP